MMHPKPGDPFVRINPQLLREPSIQSVDAEVMADFVAWVSRQRTAIATPLIRINGDELEVTRDEEYVYAVQHAQPPIEEIVCRMSMRDAEAAGPLVRLTSAQAELDRPENRFTEFVTECEVVGFLQSLSVNKQMDVQREIELLFKKLTESDDHAEIEPPFLSEVTWEDGDRRVIWTWRLPTARSMKHYIGLWQLLARIDSLISPIRSWDGGSRRAIQERFDFATSQELI